MRRAAFALAMLLMLAGIGALTVASWLLGALHVSSPSVAIAVAAAAAFAAAGVAFTAAMRRLGSPVADLIGASHRIADGDLQVRVPLAGPPALRAVAAAFNDMSDRLARQERQRRQLMADIAHELRTPLSILQGRLEGLIDGVYHADKSQLEPLLEETRVLARLVEDVRALAGAESGALTLEREATDLTMLVRDAVASVRDDAAAHSVSIAVNDAPALPSIEVDPVRVRQIVSNVLSNAVEHSGPGSIVAVKIAAAGDALEIVVADTGAGIAPEDLVRIFDRFQKRRGSRGSGLGLTIARTLARAHGGDIRAESRPGAGTTMTIRLPARSES